MDADMIGTESAPLEGRQDGRKRRAKGGSTERRNGGTTIKTTVNLPVEDWKRLQHHAVEEGVRPNVIVKRLIATGLRTVRVQVLRPGGEEASRQAAAVA